MRDALLGLSQQMLGVARQVRPHVGPRFAPPARLPAMPLSDPVAGEGTSLAEESPAVASDAWLPEGAPRAAAPTPSAPARDARLRASGEPALFADKDRPSTERSGEDPLVRSPTRERAAGSAAPALAPQAPTPLSRPPAAGASEVLDAAVAPPGPGASNPSRAPVSAVQPAPELPGLALQTPARFAGAPKPRALGSFDGPDAPLGLDANRPRRAPAAAATAPGAPGACLEERGVGPPRLVRFTERTAEPEVPHSPIPETEREGPPPPIHVHIERLEVREGGPAERRAATERPTRPPFRPALTLDAYLARRSGDDRS